MRRVEPLLARPDHMGPVTLSLTGLGASAHVLSGGVSAFPEPRLARIPIRSVVRPDDTSIICSAPVVFSRVRIAPSVSLNVVRTTAHAKRLFT